MARMAPVFGWMATTEQCCGLGLAASCWQVCCSWNCSAGLIVSLMDSPSLAGVTWVPARGIATPFGLVITCSLPVVPVRSPLYSCSRPDCPVITLVFWLTLLKPIRLAVALPSGYSLTKLGVMVMPEMPKDWIFASSVVETPVASCTHCGDDGWRSRFSTAAALRCSGAARSCATDGLAASWISGG